MLTHIVCWKYRVDVDETEREHHRQRLRELKDIIAEIESVAVGGDILSLDRSFHTGLVSTFADRPALDRYSTHTAHQEVVTIGREIAESMVSVDFFDSGNA
ncbi:MAG: Dabb family protein [Blastocatellia bacterium]|nr:Dabb family protein [Blastocatellia bacterium]